MEALREFYIHRHYKPHKYGYDNNGNLVEYDNNGGIVDTIVLPEYRSLTSDEIKTMEEKRMEEIALASEEFDKACNELYDEYKKPEYNDSTIFRLNRNVQEADNKLIAVRFPHSAVNIGVKIEIRTLDFTQLNEKRKYTYPIAFYSTNQFPLTEQYTRVGSIANVPKQIREIEKQQREVLLFEGPTTNNYGFLSIDYSSNITYNSTTYNSVKQAIAAELAKSFNDQDNLQRIMNAENPSDITYSVVDVPGDKDANEIQWNNTIKKLIVDVNINKFNTYPELKERLLQTKDAILGAYIPNDTLLGIGIPLDDNNSQQSSKWTGQNILGKALMDIRLKIKGEEIGTSTLPRKTKATVQNCMVKQIRPKYDNLKEWMEDSNHVYIARAGTVFIDKERFPKQNSIWANPYKIGPGKTRDDVIREYEVYIREKLKADPTLRNELLKLDGKVLGCWCSPEPCHGDVLLKLITEELNKPKSSANGSANSSAITAVTSAISDSVGSVTSAISSMVSSASSALGATAATAATAAVPAKTSVTSIKIPRRPRIASTLLPSATPTSIETEPIAPIAPIVAVPAAAAIPAVPAVATVAAAPLKISIPRKPKSILPQ